MNNDKKYGTWIFGLVIGAMTALMLDAPTWIAIVCAILGAASCSVIAMVWQEVAVSDNRPTEGHPQVRGDITDGNREH